jgi:tetratricopeptide (TPR) repeat protein
MKKPAALRFPAIALACMLSVAGCGSSHDAASTPSADVSLVHPPDHPELQPVALPDLSGMEAPAREQLQTRIAALRAGIEKRAAQKADLAGAYGELGKLLMAATYLDAAETCLLNAQLLAPDDRRWPYYLGHVYKAKGPLANARSSFERALQLQPDDGAAMIWLGEVHLSEGRAESAEPLFEKALAAQPDSAAALFGRGRSALARREFARAVKDLEQAAKLDPRASAIHYPLAMAYRGLGDLSQAEAHLARQGDLDTRPRDPLMEELDRLLQSPEAFNVRGGRELEAGNWPAAAENFRKGLQLAPNDPSLRHRLGTALAQMGDVRGAMAEFERVTQTSPAFARAHYSSGVLLNDARRYPEAIDRFSTALQYEPGYLPARLQLAGVLARSGRAEDALIEYEKVLSQDPTEVDAGFGHAMALVRLGRFQQARDRLAATLKTHPQHPTVRHALARLLVAAPDDRVRDSRRAKVLIDELVKEQQTIELAETAAMLLAEMGQFDEAIVVQRDVLTAAGNSGLANVVRRLNANLERYQRRQPCRVPFTEEELP